MNIEKPLVSKSSYFSDETHVFRLALSCGNHLGFCSKHPIRSNDSFEAFEEVLKKARHNNADMLLLGGNLFHESSPSQEILYKSIGLLKEHIFGDKPINYEIIWGKQAPNYACENMNIDLPIFAIHGRNENASYNDGFNTLDVLHAGNYVNIF